MANINITLPSTGQVIAISENELAKYMSLRQRQDYPLYAGHLPLANEVDFSFFATFGAGENTPRFTNLTQQGRTPFQGEYKINGIGMLIEPVIHTYSAELAAICNGYLDFKVGSQNASIFMAPLMALFTQEAKCCINGSPSVAAATTVISNSPFGGKFGFIPLPNAPFINQNTNIRVDVEWDAAVNGGSNAHIRIFFYIFGKRETPVMG